MKIFHTFEQKQPGCVHMNVSLTCLSSPAKCFAKEKKKTHFTAYVVVVCSRFMRCNLNIFKPLFIHVFCCTESMCGSDNLCHWVWFFSSLQEGCSDSDKTNRLPLMSWLQDKPEHVCFNMKSNQWCWTLQSLRAEFLPARLILITFFFHSQMHEIVKKISLWRPLSVVWLSFPGFLCCIL